MILLVSLRGMRPDMEALKRMNNLLALRLGTGSQEVSLGLPGVSFL
jgi:hypothetical protein